MDNNQQPKKNLSGFTGFIVKALPVLCIVFLSLAAVAFLYYFIEGVANAITFRTFGPLLTGFVGAITRLAFNVFIAAVLAALHKIATKD